MKGKIALAAAAMMFLSLGASAQDWRYRDRDDRFLFRRGYDSGYRCVTTGRDCQTDWKTRNMAQDDRRAFDRGFREGADRARSDNGWRRNPR